MLNSGTYFNNQFVRLKSRKQSTLPFDINLSPAYSHFQTNILMAFVIHLKNNRVKQHVYYLRLNEKTVMPVQCMCLCSIVFIVLEYIVHRCLLVFVTV